MQTLTAQPLLDIPQVATRLGTSVRHVRRLVLEKRIPYFKVGGLVRFEIEDVEAWITANRVAETGPTQDLQLLSPAELRRRLG